MNKEEFAEEITYRANKFVDNLNDSEGQLRLIKTLGVLAGQVLVDLEDSTLVDALINAIHQVRILLKYMGFTIAFIFRKRTILLQTSDARLYLSLAGFSYRR